MKKVKKDEKNNMKKCVICEQPLHKSGWYCIKCIREVKKINDFYQDKYKIKYPISKSTVAKIAQMHPNETNIFEYLYVNPSSIFQYFRLSGEEKSELREKYKKKKNVTSAKACLNEGTVYGPLCAYRLFYVGCSRARKNLLIIINREDVKNFEDKLYEKLKDCGFEVEY